MKRVLDRGNSDSHVKKANTFGKCAYFGSTCAMFCFESAENSNPHVTKSQSHMKACSSHEKMCISHVKLSFICEKMMIIIIIIFLHDTKLELRGTF